MKRKDINSLNKRIKPPAVLIEKNIFLDLLVISKLKTNTTMKYKQQFMKKTGL